ncbi:alpha/beta hydrolase family protein [Lentzea sp. E54]|uniref:alpha/beta hydrolase family protein n=1 Tax=Lentzea xerophila TaxID=3435883 RepID=UPI003DA452D2
MSIGKVAAAVVTAMVLTAPTTSAAPEGHAGGVRTTEYSLGDRAFQVPEFHTEPGGPVADIELTAVVHAPRKLVGKRPLVLLAHGYWKTCRDLEDWVWPCPSGEAFLSHRGYDYLGQELARQGFVVVSISANGVNAGELGQPADVARAMLMSKHLEMWRDLNDGKGPLAGRLRGFQGHVDLTNVGTLGHSRGGRGAVWQASDNHAHLLPAGVRIKAVLPLAPAGYYAPDPEAPENLDYRITKIPFAVLTGDCDSIAGQAAGYVRNAQGRNLAPIHHVTPHRANHNFFNTEWSYDNDGSCQDTGLSPEQQRAVAATYIPAFFRQYLYGVPSSIVSEGYSGVDVVTHQPIG